MEGILAFFSTSIHRMTDYVAISFFFFFTTLFKTRDGGTYSKERTDYAMDTN